MQEKKFEDSKFVKQPKQKQKYDVTGIFLNPM